MPWTRQPNHLLPDRLRQPSSLRDLDKAAQDHRRPLEAFLGCVEVANEDDPHIRPDLGKRTLLRDIADEPFGVGERIVAERQDRRPFGPASTFSIFARRQRALIDTILSNCSTSLRQGAEAINELGSKAVDLLVGLQRR